MYRRVTFAFVTCHVVENVNFYLPDVNENKLGVFSEVNGSN